MKKKVLKKLQLNKETVALLNGEKMSKVVGGSGDTCIYCPVEDIDWDDYISIVNENCYPRTTGSN